MNTTNEIDFSSYPNYKVVVKNNIYDLELKDTTSLKYIKKLSPKHDVDILKSQITITVYFAEDQSNSYNKLLDNSTGGLNNLILAIDAAKQYFDDYEITCKTQNIIDRYIVSLNRYDSIWNNLMSKPDYNLCLFRARMLPYFNMECKDWVKANLDALKTDYPTEIMKSSGEKDFSEEFMLAKKYNNFLEWNVLKPEEYPDMHKLVHRIKVFFELGMKKQAYCMFLKLLLSPKACHIIKEAAVWSLFKEYISKHKDLEEILRYCFHYAMYILRQEETIMFSNVPVNSRVLFTIEEAHNLPLFDKAHMERDPYIMQLTDNARLSETMPFYLRGRREINTKKEFMRRFYIATGGAFKNVDLEALGAAITGSILIPCVHKSPLEKGCEDVEWNRERKTIKLEYPYMIDTPTTPEDIAFANYLERYYPSYVSLTDSDYMAQLGTTQIGKSEITEDITYVSDETKTPPDLPKKEKKMEVENKSVKPVIEYNQLADIDVSITTRDHEKFKANALKLYEYIKQNCQHRGEVSIREVRTLASVKYKLFGPGLPRPIDIFRIPYSPIKMVKKFHVHPVKMFYNNEVTLFRSCIASLLSGVGESYKWFSCNKVPASVLLKYAQRGFSIILNKNERTALSKYIVTDERWNSMLKYLEIDADKIYCTVQADHPFFRPGIYDSGIRMTLRNFEKETNGQYANTMVVTYPTSLFPYGELLVKDNRKFYPPNVSLINSCLEYVENAEIVDEDS
jgi:hypothetical protein